MKRLLLVAFAAFFVSASWAQEVPRVKPECIKLNEFLDGFEYQLGFHPRMKRSAFAYVSDMDAIIIIWFEGPCLSNKSGLVLKRGTRGFGPLYSQIFAGRDA